jgi:epoxyqueuosine reductase
VTPVETAELVRRAARQLGFARVAFTPARELARYAVYRDWLARGYAGEMRYLDEQAAPRRDPRALLAAARTLVTVALSYAHADPVDVPADRLAGGPRGTLARYARGADYHTVMKTKLHALVRQIAAGLGREVAYLACVDTAPLLEREAAHAGGLGFIAKNTMLIAPGAGSYLVLGELLLDAECEPGAIDNAPRCGQCRACLDACPTGAFVDAYTLDARRCISYLTIELTGAIPRELRPLVGDRVFGCDVCQEVCPFNAAERGPGASELAPRAGYARPSLVRLLGLGAAQFRKWQRRSALRRVHRAQLRRNVAVALGNVGTAAELPPLEAALADAQPLVRAHAAWAVGRIGARHADARERACGILSQRLPLESDPSVRTEIEATLKDL